MAETPVAHSRYTDMTACTVCPNASGHTMRQHVQHPSQMQYIFACFRHDASPRVHCRNQPCDYIHAHTGTRASTLSVSLLPHVPCTNTTAHAVHCTCSVPVCLSECDGPYCAPVTTAQHTAYIYMAETPVTHSRYTDMTACTVCPNASGHTMRQHVQHPSQMQYIFACFRHDASPRVHCRNQPCDYIHAHTGTRASTLSVSLLPHIRATDHTAPYSLQPST
eukprot:COSAG01_NODE_6900_length_3445_cov_135.942917_1_plen_221_part_00